MALTGCGGDDGAPGQPGLPAGIDIGNAAEIHAFIDGVTIASPAVVDFTLMDGNGTPIKNLPAGSISFKLAKLVPGTDGNASAWQSYINEMEQPGAGPGTEAKTQAATENGSLGTLVDNQDGTYRYTFSFDIATVTTPISVSYQPTLTHRVTFEIRGFAPVRNPFFDIRPSDNATAGLFTRGDREHRPLQQLSRKPGFSRRRAFRNAGLCDLPQSRLGGRQQRQHGGYDGHGPQDSPRR